MLGCMWEFIRDPTNQNTLGWIGTSAVAVTAALWGAYRRLREYQRNADLSPRSRILKLAISAIIWVIILVAILVVVWVAFWIYDGAKRYCSCYRNTNIVIKAPLDGGTVSFGESFSIIRGDATPNQTCRFVYLFVRDMASGRIVATDLTQTLGNGEWAARLDMRHVAEQGQAHVHAVLTDQPTYPLGSHQAVPPVDGRPSQEIKLWRQ